MKDNSGSAFPLHKTESEWSDSANGYVMRQYSDGGMTLRQYYAAAALQGMCANSFADGQSKPLSYATAVELAQFSYEIADAMIAAGKK